MLFMVVFVAITLASLAFVSDAIAEGQQQGTCFNCDRPMCQCNTSGGWGLSQLGVCNCNDESCKEDIDADVCSDRGSCACDSCICGVATDNQVLYSGRYCQRCVHPQCASPSGSCTDHVIQECVICVHEQDRLNENVAAKCDSVCRKRDVFYRILQQLPDCTSCSNETQSTSFCSLCERFSIDPSFYPPSLCSMDATSDNCRLWYQIVWEKNQNRFEVNVRRFVQEQDCYVINILLIVLCVVLGIVLIGILLLLLWKFFQTVRDRQEYLKFLQESIKNKSWQMENPLFRQPIMKTINPKYGGNPPGMEKGPPPR